MVSIFKFEWKRMIHSKTFLVSLILSYGIIIVDVIAWYKLYREGVDVDTSVFYKWLGVNRGMNAGVYFFTAMPLLTAFAYSWSISFDRNSNYIIQVMTRCSRIKYFTAKYIVSFISGGLVFASSLILDFMLLSLFTPAYRPIPNDLMSAMDPFRFCSALFYRNPYLFLLIWIGVAFLWGGAMSSIGIAAGMFIRKYIITSIVSFITFISEQVLSVYISDKYLFAINGNAITLGWTDMLYAAPMSATLPEHVLFSIFVIIIVSTLMYSLRCRRYECL